MPESHGRCFCTEAKLSTHCYGIVFTKFVRNQIADCTESDCTCGLQPEFQIHIGLNSSFYICKIISCVILEHLLYNLLLNKQHYTFTVAGGKKSRFRLLSLSNPSLPQSIPNSAQIVISFQIYLGEQKLPTPSKMQNCLDVVSRPSSHFIHI